MFYELEIRMPPRVLPMWSVRIRHPFMAFSVGDFIDQPGGAPFKIEQVRHTFDVEDGTPIHRIELIVSE